MDSVPDYMKSLQNIVGGQPLLATPASSSSGTSNISVSAVQDKSKLKFMLVSTHCHQYTGYSKVSYGLIRQLAKVPWLSVTHYAFQKFPQH